MHRLCCFGLDVVSEPNFEKNGLKVCKEDNEREKQDDGSSGQKTTDSKEEENKSNFRQPYASCPQLTIQELAEDSSSPGPVVTAIPEMEDPSLTPTRKFFDKNQILTKTHSFKRMMSFRSSRKNSLVLNSNQTLQAGGSSHHPLQLSFLGQIYGMGKRPSLRMGKRPSLPSTEVIVIQEQISEKSQEETPSS